MIYLSGAPYAGAHELVGLMATPDSGNSIPRKCGECGRPVGDYHHADCSLYPKRVEGMLWAFDNACFNHPEGFEWERWHTSLQRRLSQGRDRCLFVVSPDVPFDAAGTRRRFDEYRERLLELEVPLAFVLQDGVRAEDVPWSDVAAIFTGGSTAFKTPFSPRREWGVEAPAIIAEARARGVWVHMGRVNSRRRLQLARSMGADSCDGTFPKYAPDLNWERLLGWLRDEELCPVMDLSRL